MEFCTPVKTVVEQSLTVTLYNVTVCHYIGHSTVTTQRVRTHTHRKCANRMCPLTFRNRPKRHPGFPTKPSAARNGPWRQLSPHSCRVGSHRTPSKRHEQSQGLNIIDKMSATVQIIHTYPLTKFICFRCISISAALIKWVKQSAPFCNRGIFFTTMP